MEESALEKICQVFPFLKDAEAEVRERLLSHAIIMRIPKGKIIFLEGDECRQLALIISGTVRVYKVAEICDIVTYDMLSA